MLTAGDELGRTQKVNNNAYCQDNEINWIDWKLDERQQEQLRFAIDVLRIRRNNAVLRRRSFFFGQPVAGGDTRIKDLAWYRPDGKEMAEPDWKDPGRRMIGMLIAGDAADEVDEQGRRIPGNTLMVLLNGGEAEVAFRLPVLVKPGIWRELVNTDRPGRRWVEDIELKVAGYSLILLEYNEA